MLCRHYIELFPGQRAQQGKLLCANLHEHEREQSDMAYVTTRSNISRLSVGLGVGMSDIISVLS